MQYVFYQVICTKAEDPIDSGIERYVPVMRLGYSLESQTFGISPSVLFQLTNHGLLVDHHKDYLGTAKITRKRVRTVLLVLS